MADQRKDDLIRQLDQARSQAGFNRRALAQDVRVGDKVKSNLNRFRGVWLTGAVLLGLVLTKLPPRTKKVVVPRRGAKAEREVKKAGEAGIAMIGLKFLFDFVKPYLMTYVSQRLGWGPRPAKQRW